MLSQTRCVVTGLGLICALGDNVDECWSKAKSGQSGIKEVRSVDTTGCYANLGAEVAAEDLPGENFDRSVSLCIKAASEALKDASYDLKDKNVGVIMGSCVGGAVSIDKYYSDKLNGRQADPKDILNMPASAIANNVAFYFGFNGITANIVNACAAGTMSIAYACDRIRSGNEQIFLAGGSDSFSSLAFSGFHALKALDENPCSPFNHSHGITLGEGAAVLVVESYEHAVNRGAKIYCEILGSGISSDAHHITAPRPDGEGQMLAIARAVEHSDLTFNDIDYINAHGTGTAKNDEAEFLSLRTLFDHNDHLSVSSTKSMTGHCLGAAGSIEAVLTVKAMQDELLPPTTGFNEEDLPALKEKGGNIDFVTSPGKKKKLHYAMSNSFAFGGNNASIIFSDGEHAMPCKKSDEKIYITGIGALCPDAQTSYKIDLAPSDFNEHGIKVGFSRKLDHFSQLQLISGVEAISDAALMIDDSNANEIGILIGTADGPMTEITGFQKKAITDGVAKGSAFTFPNTVYNAAGGYLSIFTGIKGYNVTIANSAQAGIQSIVYAAEVLKYGDEKIMLACGTDENTETNEELNKYSGKTQDFRLGEGSVTLVLEKESSAAKRNVKPVAELAGCFSSHKSVGFDTLEGSEDAMKNAISGACEMAGISLNDIDAVCGSVYGDLFGREIPLIDVREQIGEARAAAAAMQVATAARILNGDLDQFDADNFNYILAVAAGLGGSYSAVVLKKAGDNDE